MHGIRCKVPFHIRRNTVGSCTMLLGANVRSSCNVAVSSDMLSARVQQRRHNLVTSCPMLHGSVRTFPTTLVNGVLVDCLHVNQPQQDDHHVKTQQHQQLHPSTMPKKKTGQFNYQHCGMHCRSIQGLHQHFEHNTLCLFQHHKNSDQPQKCPIAAAPTCVNCPIARDLSIQYKSPIEACEPVWDTENGMEDPHMCCNPIGSRMGGIMTNVADVITNRLIKETLCLESHFKTTAVEMPDDNVLVRVTTPPTD
jgi:hypothetical protein